MRKILGINISHNCSFAYFEDQTLKEYYEEDRFNLIKGFEPPLDNYQYEVLKKFKDVVFDGVAFVSYDRWPQQEDKIIIDNILTQVNTKDYHFFEHEHHLLHVYCGMYFSKFDEALCLVTDGGGERIHKWQFQTIESIWKTNKNKIDTKHTKTTPLYKHATSCRYDFWNTYEIKKQELNYNDGYDTKLSNHLCAGQKFSHYKHKANFKQAGFLMGVAAYKNKKTSIDPKILDYAHKAQEETLEERIDLIKKAMTYSDCKNIILSGGYHMNCANNFKLVKHFPECNFFVDPIANDAGTAVGAAYCYENTFK